LVLTPADESMSGAVIRAIGLVERNEHYYMPDQFRNPANPAIHRETTGPEILSQLNGDPIDAFVAGIGTGGTITGVGGAFLDVYPECRIVGLEPDASPVLSGGVAGPHKIQGNGAGFVPENLDRSILTEIRRVTDDQAYVMSKRLAKEEGLLVGISSGSNVHVATQIAAELGPGKRVITMLCDTGERYFSLDEHFR